MMQVDDEKQKAIEEVVSAYSQLAGMVLGVMESCVPKMCERLRSQGKLLDFAYKHEQEMRERVRRALESAPNAKAVDDYAVAIWDIVLHEKFEEIQRWEDDE